jgi:hypothetical protein
MMRRAFLLSVAAVLIAASAVCADDTAVEGLLPRECPAGWRMQGKAAVYTPENLYKYINGEAELYMPYGFERVATALYTRQGGTASGIVVNIFRMGSPLDAFGIYANYRTPAADQVQAGAEGFGDESQVMFYQDRYFVQAMASGSLDAKPALFNDCAATAAKSLPAGRGKPPELRLLQVPGLVPRSEKYYAGGLLGYGFFGRGLTAEIEQATQRLKAVVALAGSEGSAKKVIDDYARHLRGAKAAPEVSDSGKSMRLIAVDPLYKGVFFEQSGRYVVGVTGLGDPRDGSAVVAELVKRLPAD